MAPPLVAFDHTRGEFAPHRVELLDPDVIFEPRDCRLRGEGGAIDGIPSEHERVHRIVGEAVGIVGVGMPARDAEHPLAEQVPQRMPDLPGLPIVNQAPGEALDHAVLHLSRLEQDSAAIGARVLLIERGDEGRGEEVREEHSLWCRARMRHTRLHGRKSQSSRTLYDSEASFVSPGISPS